MSNWMNIDFFIFFLLAFNTLLGMARGGLKEMISAMCLSAALIFTIKFTVPIANFINNSPLIGDVITSSPIQNFMQQLGMPPLTRAMLLNLGFGISLLICFVGMFSTCEAVLSYANVIQAFSFQFSYWNRKVGAALGCLRGYVFTLVFILIYILFFQVPLNSYFVQLFYGSSTKLQSLIASEAPERYREIFQNKDAFNSQQVIRYLKQ